MGFSDVHESFAAEDKLTIDVFAESPLGHALRTVVC